MAWGMAIAPAPNCCRRSGSAEVRRVAEPPLPTPGAVGADDGGEGMKLKQRCLVTETGLEVRSRFPFEDALAP